MVTKTTIHTATFTKQNGEKRTMNFVRLPDLPKEFLSDVIKNSSNAKIMKEGNELVWDLDKNNFRVFNWNAVEGEVEKDQREVTIGS